MPGRYRLLACSSLNQKQGCAQEHCPEPSEFLVAGRAPFSAQGHPEMVSTVTGHQPGLMPGAHRCLNPGDGGGMTVALVT